MLAVKPKQKRSMARVARLLDAAESLVTEHGVQGFALSAVAKLTGTAQGSLYQYFPSRDALLGSLHERYVKEALAAMDGVEAGFAETSKPSPEILVALAFQHFVNLYAPGRAYRAIRSATHISANTIENRLDEEIVTRMSALISVMAPGVNDGRTGILARVLVEMGDTFLPLVHEDRMWRIEGARAMIGYLRDAVWTRPAGKNSTV